MIDAAKFLSNRRFTVLFSGGKDSTAVLLWVLDNVKHDRWNILYVEVTGNTHPHCTEYVVKLCDELKVGDRLIIARSERDFYELMDRWGPPIPFGYRWCLYLVKLKLFNKYAYYITVDGIRKSDSKVRRRAETLNILKIADRISVSPIVTWSKSQVYEYIMKHNVPLNPCYSLYGHSGNCMFCPFADERHIALTMTDPYWGGKIASILEKHRDKMMRGKIGRQIYNRWMKYAKQKSIREYLNVNMENCKARSKPNTENP